MKILHIEAEFIPHVGYQVNVLAKYMAKKGHDVSILTTELKHVRKHQRVYLNELEENYDDMFCEKFGIKIARIPTYGILSDRHIWSSIRGQIKRLNPDIIFLHNNDTFVSIRYLLFDLFAFNRPIIMDSHMVKIASKNKFASFFRFFYRLFITPIIIRNHIYVVRTVDVDYLQEAFNIPSNLTPIISFGADTDLFLPNENKKKYFREYYSINQNERIFMYAGKLSIDKDGLFLASSIKKSFKTSSRKPVFVVIGNASGDYGKAVEELFNQSENRVIRLPLQKHSSLAEYFQFSDVGMIPTAGSLIYFDMQAAGLPIVWSDLEMNRVRHNVKSGRMFKPQSKSDFRLKVQEYLDMDEDELMIESKESRAHILKNYSYENITNEFLRLMEKEIKYRKENPFK